MFFTKRRLNIMLVFAFFVLGAALSGCNFPGIGEPSPTTDPNLIYTQAALTVAAELTRSASGGQATQQPPTATQPVVVITATPLPPTATPLPTNTPITPVPTRAATPCDRASFVKDVTYPDGSELPPGTEYIKTWRLKNNGSCTWNSSYDLVFYDKNAMGGPAASQLTTGTVPPGGTIDVSVKLTSPDTQGTHQGDWKLRNGSDVVFGIGENAQSYFWVKITVVDVVNYDFLAKAKNADWYNATEAIDFGDHNDDSPGVAA